MAIIDQVGAMNPDLPIAGPIGLGESGRAEITVLARRWSASRVVIRESRSGERDIEGWSRLMG